MVERPLSGDSRERVSKVSKRDILKAMSINDMVKSIDEDKGEEATNWTVWVGGSEVNSHLLTQSKAISIANDWFSRGYDDVVVKEVKSE